MPNTYPKPIHHDKDGLVRCQCESFGCGSQSNNGQTGRLVNSRTFIRHQKEDSFRSVREKYKAAVASSDAQLVEAVQNLKVNDQAIPPQKTHKSSRKVDVLVDALGKVMDDIERLYSEASHLQHTTAAVDVEKINLIEIEDIISQIDDIKLQEADIKRNLKLSQNATYHSVVVLREAAAEKVSPVFSTIAELESTWNHIRKRRKAEYNSTIEGGGVDTSYHFSDILEGVSPLLQLTAIMVVACQVLFGFPRRGCEWLFDMAGYIIQTTAWLASQSQNNLPSYFQDLVSNFPRHTRTATSHFKLETKSVIRAACPRCHATHEPAYEKNIPIYPRRCTARRHGSRCRELIVRPKKIANEKLMVPIIPYVAFDFKDWLANLLSREGYEETMDNVWTRLESEVVKMTDIFDGSVIRNLKGPDGQRHFRHAGNGQRDGHYLFSLSVDFFNPLRNLAAGKKISVGVISMACLNLPIEERYKPENIFVAGIIPGPKEVSVDGVNGYIRHIVDALLEFWNGVRFTRTALYSAGRTIFCAVVVVICDLPAARKVGGFGSHNMEYFCSVCWCSKRLNTYKDFDIASWDHRTNEECRKHAEAYKSAASPSEARSIFDSTGIRWSELLRLPYYEPSRFLVVDSMHDLFLGLVKRHIQDILGYRSKSTHKNVQSNASVTMHTLPNLINESICFNNPVDQQNQLPSSQSEQKSVRKLISTLKSATGTDLNNLITQLPYSSIHKSSIIYVGRGIGCIPSTISSQGENLNPTILNSSEIRDDSVDVVRKALAKRFPTKHDLINIIATWHLSTVNKGEQTQHYLEEDDIKRDHPPSPLSELPIPTQDGLHLDNPDDPQNQLPEKINTQKEIRQIIILLRKHADVTKRDELSRQLHRYHKDSLVYVGRGLGFLSQGGNRKITKDSVATFIMDWQYSLNHGNSINDDDTRLQHEIGQILDDDDMENLWHDICNTVKPSWVSTLPAGFSPSSGPKLKSDQWRTLASLYLPVTLIRTWSGQDINAGKHSKKHQSLLDLTMSLTSAIIVATSRETSEAHADMYMQHMTAYRQKLKDLFPNYKCHCIHHMAMHIGDFIRMYGPVHGWWTYPFERVIGMLQRIPVNYKPTEYEETIALSWHRSSNLRAFFRRAGCPSAIKNCALLFNKLVRSEIRNSLVVDAHFSRPAIAIATSSFTKEALGRDILTALEKKYPDREIPKMAFNGSRICYEGVAYSSSHIFDGSSCVQLQGDETPFAITGFLHFSETDESSPSELDTDYTFIVVRRYCPAKVHKNPYQHYPVLGATLWRDELSQEVEVAQVSEIEAQCAKCSIAWEDQRLVVVVPLSRSLQIQVLEDLPNIYVPLAEAIQADR